MKYAGRVPIVFRSIDTTPIGQNSGALMTGKSDDEIRVQIMDSIGAIPSVKSGDCEVYVNAGVVTLSGKVNSYQALSDIELRVSKVSEIHGIQTYVQSDFGADSDRRCAAGDRRGTARDRRFPEPD